MNSKMPHHRRFLADNQLSPADLPEGIRAKIRIFDGVEALLPDTLADDRKQLERHLFKIDLELVGDLHEEFFEEAEVLPDDPDLAVLLRLWERGERKGLSRTYLRQQGFSGRLDAAHLKVADFHLRRKSQLRWVFNLERE